MYRLLNQIKEYDKATFYNVAKANYRYYYKYLSTKGLVNLLLDFNRYTKNKYCIYCNSVINTLDLLHYNRELSKETIDIMLDNALCLLELIIKEYENESKH